MSKFRVDKLSYTISFAMIDGSRMEGNIFLDLYSPIHQGRELVKDLLESESMFLPLEIEKTKSVVFINKACVVKATLRERDSQEDLSLGEQKSIEISLTTGDNLIGKINLAMPGEKVRVSDFLYLSPKWIYLYRDDQDVILNSSFIKSIQLLV